MSTRFACSAAGATAMIVVGVTQSAAQAQDVADFFKKQPFTIVVGSAAGGSYDFYARALARHMGNHLPGNPTVVVQNMPGGGGYLAANHIYSAAPKDGSMIATFSRSVPMQPLYDKTGVAFDPLKLAWIGSPSDEASVAITWHTTPIKTFADLRQNGMTVASTGPGTDSNVYARVITNIFKLRNKIVTGYRGSGDMLLATERGEVQGIIGVSWSSVYQARREWVETGKLNFLAQLAITPRGGHLKTVPLIGQLADNDDDRRVLEVIFARQSVAFPFAAPPEVPAPRLEAIRKAFMATLADRQFLADAEKANMSIAPVTGQQMADMLKKIYASDTALVDRVKAVLADK